jgi:hypothetical protein
MDKSHIVKPEISHVSIFLFLCTLLMLDKGGQGLLSFIIFSFSIEILLNFFFLINLE